MWTSPCILLPCATCFQELLMLQWIGHEEQPIADIQMFKCGAQRRHVNLGTVNVLETCPLRTLVSHSKARAPALYPFDAVGALPRSRLLTVIGEFLGGVFFDAVWPSHLKMFKEIRERKQTANSKQWGTTSDKPELPPLLFECSQPPRWAVFGFIP